MENGKNLYIDIPQMSNEEYRENLKKLFERIDNNIVLRYFYTLCVKLEMDWN